MADARVPDWDATAYRFFQRVREDLSLGGLETALEANDGGKAAELVNRALDRAVEAHLGDFLAWHQITYIEGAQAEARAARARGSWVSSDTGPSGLKGVSRKRLTEGNVGRIRLTSAEDLLSKNSASTLQGVVNGREVRAEYVTQGPDRRGAYWRVYVDGELHSHFRSEAGVQRYAAVALNQADLPKFAFNVADPRSIRWAREQSSRLVTEILPETRKAVQQTISDGISQGIPPRRNANRIRSEVGMRTDQVQMVRNLGDELDSARAGTVVTRFPPRPGVRKTAGFKAKVPDRSKIGEPAYQAWRTKQLDRYREMQHRYRSRLIARTETGRSAAAGQLGMWKQAAASGAIPSTIKRKWITTRDGRERPEHLDHHGEVVGINEEWPWGYEVQTQPNCRCGQGLVDTEAVAVETAPASETTASPLAEAPRFQTVAQGQEWLKQTYFDEVEFPGIRVDQLQEIADGVHAVLGPVAQSTSRPIRVGAVGWIVKGARGKNATYRPGRGKFSSEMRFQKTYTKGASRANVQEAEVYARMKARKLADRGRTLDDLRERGQDSGPVYDRLLADREVMERVERWTVSQASGRPLFGTAAHEAGHALHWVDDEGSRHINLFRQELGSRGVTRLKKASVSEYAMSDDKELFAEIASLHAEGRGGEIDSDVYDAWLATVDEIVKFRSR